MYKHPATLFDGEIELIGSRMLSTHNILEHQDISCTKLCITNVVTCDKDCKLCNRVPCNVPDHCLNTIHQAPRLSGNLIILTCQA